MTAFEPLKRRRAVVWFIAIAAVVGMSCIPGAALASIDGVTGPAFALSARAGYVSIADGGSIYSWGYTTGTDMQLPGPTLIVTQGQVVTVTLYNDLPAAAGEVSIVFPGHEVTTSGGVPGALTQEAPAGGSVEYTFTAGEPGTYQYHSGTRPDLQVEMGLYGAIVVRPNSPPACTTAYTLPPDAPLDSGAAYNHAGTCFDREYLFLLSEIDIDVHRAAELQASGPGPIDVGSGPYHPEYWLMNGRAGPDTLAAAGTGLFPTQPYNIIPRMHPGERLLMRVVGAGREMHPFHHHGNHSRVLARDGRLILSETDPNQLAGPLLFTIQSVPGETVDAIFEWTGKDLGWDIYGHDVADPMEPHEYAPDHGKPIPVTLPDLSVLAFGGFYSGSPYLGALGSLPPGEGGLNPDAGYTFMWHSHTERELVNNDVFPGGMMTMLIVEAPGVEIIEAP
jgi:FtsP/CotA-like multicopper oxidase with cupredoxin domain